MILFGWFDAIICLSNFVMWIVKQKIENKQKLFFKNVFVDIFAHLLDVESETGAHEHGQLDEKHVPAEVVQGVGESQGPEGHGRQDVLPRHGQLGSRLLKNTRVTTLSIWWSKS